MITGGGGGGGGNSTTLLFWSVLQHTGHTDHFQCSTLEWVFSHFSPSVAELALLQKKRKFVEFRISLLWFFYCQSCGNQLGADGILWFSLP